MSKKDARVIGEVRSQLVQKVRNMTPSQLKEVINELEKVEQRVGIIPIEFRTVDLVAGDVITHIENLAGTKVSRVAKVADIDPVKVAEAIQAEDAAKERLANAESTIRDKVSSAMTALKEATALADEIGVEVSFDLAYGMGGTYIPKGRRDPTSWYSSNDEDILQEGRWVSSTEMC